MSYSIPSFLLVVVVCGGCVAHKSCSVTSGQDYTEVEVRKDWHGIVAGICGLTTHAASEHTFRLPDHKSEYSASEMVEVGPGAVTNVYTGSISLDRARKQVVVKLMLYGDPLDLNGTYHYK